MNVDYRAIQKLMRATTEFRKLYPYITVECVDVFLTVALLGQPSTVEVAASVNSSRSTASRFLQDLKKHGLVEGHTDPLDRRLSRHRVTPTGRQLVNLLTAIVNA